MGFDVNILAVLASGVAGVVIGMAWYAPTVFGSLWMKEAGLDPNSSKMEEGKKKMPLHAATAFVAGVVLAWVMAYFALVWGSATLGSALELGFWIWLGFMVPGHLSSVLWEGKSLKYFAINAGFWLVNTLVVATIVSVWM